MTIKPRPYTGLQDFILMTSILAVGRKTTEYSYYVHTGDLSWWMFYTDADPSQWTDRIYLWLRDGCPCGWSLIDPDWCSFDIYLLPAIHNSNEETYILDWTIQQASEIIRKNGGHQIRTLWVSEQDYEHIGLLESREFVRAESFMWYMEHPLNAKIPEINLPRNYLARSIRGESEIHQRAAASYSAFQSQRKFDAYVPRYQRFMSSPVYNPNLDLVIEAPDGQFASFCIIWPDPINHIGLFEPVGTQIAFQGQGFGKAVIASGLRQLDDWGMDRAMVCVESDNSAAMKLYQSVGFEPIFKLHTFYKSV